MTCLICKNGKTLKGKATVTLTRGATILVIRGVPARICRNCGEEYVDEAAALRAPAAARVQSRRGARRDEEGGGVDLTHPASLSACKEGGAASATSRTRATHSTSCR